MNEKLKNSLQIESNHTNDKKDYHMLVLLVIAFLICLTHVAGNFSFKDRNHANPDREKESTDLFIWLSGPRIEEGLYQVPASTSLSDLVKKTNHIPPNQDLTDEEPESLATVRLQDGSPPELFGPRPEIAPLFFRPIPINEADKDLLITIPGIGETLANRILELRREKGGFQDKKELLQVSGLGPGKLKKIEKLITM